MKNQFKITQKPKLDGFAQHVNISITLVENNVKVVMQINKLIVKLKNVEINLVLFMKILAIKSRVQKSDEFVQIANE